MKQASIQVIEKPAPAESHCTIGERLVPFTPSDYPDDAALIERIKNLSAKPSYRSREVLIAIAGYIQTEIVGTGKTAVLQLPGNSTRF